MYFFPLPRMYLGAGFARSKHCFPLPDGESTQVPREPTDRRGRELSLGWDGLGWAAGEQKLLAMCGPFARLASSL